MKIERTLKKIGGSVMVPIPAEILRELHWEPGLKVSVDSEGGDHPDRAGRRASSRRRS